jgi:large subunit ribosomal protein L34e
MKDTRVVLRRHCPFPTKKNKIKRIKTPGNRINIQYLNKKSSNVRCAETQVQIKGVSSQRSLNFMRICKNKKKVSRIYGGHLSARATQNRILKSFLIEEKKIVKKFLKNKN